MFRNWLSAAWGDLRRSPVQSFIAIGGLAVGLCAAILAGLVIVNQTSYDHFLPGYDRIYLATVKGTLGGRPPDYFPYTPHDVGARLRQDFPEIEAVSRFKIDTSSLRHGNTEASETVYNAEPNIFALLPLPLLYGNLDSALAQPDSIVIPRQIARKYFGRDNVVGETLELDRQHPLKITAVIADLPAKGTILESAIFTSARAAYSPIVKADSNPPNAPGGGFGLDLQTMVRLKPGTNLDALQNRMLSMSDALLPRPPAIAADLYLMRLDQLHLSPFYSPGIRDRLAAFGVIAILILFLSSVNFINLSTARAAQRGVEVGVRKAVGAGRVALIAQFLGESVLQMMLALCLALAVAEWALPAVNAFLNSGAVLDYWRDPALIAVLLLGAGAVGVLAGAYPAFVMSSFRPATVLKGLTTGSARGGWIRQILVTLQFAVLVLLERFPPDVNLFEHRGIP